MSALFIRPSSIAIAEGSKEMIFNVSFAGARMKWALYNNDKSLIKILEDDAMVIISSRGRVTDEDDVLRSKVVLDHYGAKVLFVAKTKAIRDTKNELKRIWNHAKEFYTKK